MIDQLKENIDQIITEKYTKEYDWLLYEKCKQQIRNWERNNKMGFTPDEYGDYIKYICDKLDL